MPKNSIKTKTVTAKTVKMAATTLAVLGFIKENTQGSGLVISAIRIGVKERESKPKK